MIEKIENSEREVDAKKCGAQERRERGRCGEKPDVAEENFSHDRRKSLLWGHERDQERKAGDKMCSERTSLSMQEELVHACMRKGRDKKRDEAET